MINDFLLQYIIAFLVLILVLAVVMFRALFYVLRDYVKGGRPFAGPVCLIIVVVSAIGIATVGYSMFEDYQSEDHDALFMKGFTFLPGVMLAMIVVIRLLGFFLGRDPFDEGDEDISNDKRRY